MSKSVMVNCDFLILGYGYTASFLKDYLKNKEPNSLILTTSRQGGDHIQFNLHDESTWTNLPAAKVTFWTFPAEPINLVKKLYELKKEILGQVIVIGSTGAFKVDAIHQGVDETSELDQSQARVQGEEFLNQMGSILVFSSGIYGSQRNPLDWVKKGMVGRSQKWVNMIHVADLCQFLYQAYKIGLPKEKYIASDNNPKKWQEVIQYWESKGLIKDTPERESLRLSKKIDSTRSIKDLRIKLQYPDFSKAVVDRL